ncbi:substrate-binding domain-containing protein [Alloacidobacterium sp.]|uniref:substrate-binding domain-containing protein n=1 Tax=Alloacidobacterium sp. TaxID=2951999 RepID=UPI002D4156CF|nr:substrate-binding domain-containing protein [Alloacidobacterium sp.]HYK37754.1 substrate-binding domain-containing protein [Alloacidobacterium sp.]
MSQPKIKRLYLIPILSKALDILELLEGEKRPITLEAIYQRSHISKTSVYRILKTFVHRGYVAQSPDGSYRLVSRPKKMRFGFAGQSAEMPFSEAVTSSLRAAAAASGVELIVRDNRYDADTAVKNAKEFVAEGVDIVIEFQIEEHVAPYLAHIIARAGIPLIAIDIPHPHASYFGVDNFQVGFEAGELLAHHAISKWKKKVDWVLGLDVAEAGSLVQSRITGAFEGVRSLLPEIPQELFIRLDGRGMRETSARVVSDFFRRHARTDRILIAAATDTSAVGALQATMDAQREKNIAIVGQDCIPEVLEEMKKPHSPIIGSISHEAHTYGPRLIQLGVTILRGHTVPPYNYVQHRVVTASMLQEEE